MGAGDATGGDGAVAGAVHAGIAGGFDELIEGGGADGGEEGAEAGPEELGEVDDLSADGDEVADGGGDDDHEGEAGFAEVGVGAVEGGAWGRREIGEGCGRGCGGGFGHVKGLWLARKKVNGALY